MNDRYLVLCGQARSASERMLLSCLPALAMLEKLMTRKERGKKPYSEGFCFEERLKALKEAQQRLLSALEEGNADERLVIACLEPLAQTTEMACQEVRMASLKEDFVWIGKTIRNTMKIYRTETEEEER